MVLTALRSRYRFAYLGPDGREINRIFQAIDPAGTMAPLDVWETHLREKLAFPYTAVVVEAPPRGIPRAVDKIRLEGIGAVDYLSGIVVIAGRGRDRFQLPPSALAAADHEAPEYSLVECYSLWFANQ